MVGYIVEIDGAEYVVMGHIQETEETVRKNVKEAWDESNHDHEQFREKLLDMGYDMDVIMGTIKI